MRQPRSVCPNGGRSPEEVAARFGGNRSDSSCCTPPLQMRQYSACFSILRIPIRTHVRTTYSALLRKSACRQSLSARVRHVILAMSLLNSPNRERVASSSPTMSFSSAQASDLPPWRSATAFPRSSRGLPLPLPAAWSAMAPDSRISPSRHL